MKNVKLFLSGLFLVGILLLARAAAQSTPATASYGKGHTTGLFMK
jgi:hypothetical protein